MAGLTLDIGANTRDFIKGTTDVEQALGKVSDSLDDSSTDGDKLERKFSQNMRDIASEASKAGEKIGEDISDGTDAASEGIDTMQEKGLRGAARIGGSFKDVGSVIDGIQRTASTALSGFGPAGIAAGALAATGLGLVTEEIDKQKKLVDELKEYFRNAYQAAAEEGRVFLDEATIQAQVIDTYFDPEKFKDAQEEASKIGVAVMTYVRGQSGDMEALNTVIDASTAAEQRRLDKILEQNGVQGGRLALGDNELNTLKGITRENEQILEINKFNKTQAELLVATRNEEGEAIRATNKSLAETPKTVPVTLSVDRSALDNITQSTFSTKLRLQLEDRYGRSLQ